MAPSASVTWNELHGMITWPERSLEHFSTMYIDNRYQVSISYCVYFRDSLTGLWFAVNYSHQAISPRLHYAQNLKISLITTLVRIPINNYASARIWREKKTHQHDSSWYDTSCLLLAQMSETSMDTQTVYLLYEFSRELTSHFCLCLYCTSIRDTAHPKCLIGITS